MGKLNRLELVVDDGDWIGMSKSKRNSIGRKTAIKRIDQVPGLHALAKLCSKAEVVEVVCAVEGSS